MAITLTAIHKRRVADQVMQNLVGLQRDMVQNATTHKAMAQASVAVLQTIPALQAEVDRIAALNRPAPDEELYQAQEVLKAAQNQVIPVVTLRSFMNDAAAAYLQRLQWVIDLRNAPVKRQRLLDILAAYGVSEAEIVSVVTELRSAAVALRDAPKGGYPAMIAACDAVLSTVDPVDSLWPE